MSNFINDNFYAHLIKKIKLYLFFIKDFVLLEFEPISCVDGKELRRVRALKNYSHNAYSNVSTFFRMVPVRRR